MNRWQVNTSTFHIIFGVPLDWSLKTFPAVGSMGPSLMSYMIGKLWLGSIFGSIYRTEQKIEESQHMKLRRSL